MRPGSVSIITVVNKKWPRLQWVSLGRPVNNSFVAFPQTKHCLHCKHWQKSGQLSGFKANGLVFFLLGFPAADYLVHYENKTQLPLIPKHVRPAALSTHIQMKAMYRQWWYSFWQLNSVRKPNRLIFYIHYWVDTQTRSHWESGH